MEQKRYTLEDIVEKLVDFKIQKYIDKLNELEKRIEALEPALLTPQVCTEQDIQQ